MDMLGSARSIRGAQSMTRRSAQFAYVVLWTTLCLYVVVSLIRSGHNEGDRRGEWISNKLLQVP